jgi:hypothetical protein
LVSRGIFIYDTLFAVASACNALNNGWSRGFVTKGRGTRLTKRASPTGSRHMSLITGAAPQTLNLTLKGIRQARLVCSGQHATGAVLLRQRLEAALFSRMMPVPSDNSIRFGFAS